MKIQITFSLIAEEFDSATNKYIAKGTVGTGTSEVIIINATRNILTNLTDEKWLSQFDSYEEKNNKKRLWYKTTSAKIIDYVSNKYNGIIWYYDKAPEQLHFTGV